MSVGRGAWHTIWDHPFSDEGIAPKATPLTAIVDNCTIDSSQLPPAYTVVVIGQPRVAQTNNMTECAKILGLTLSAASEATLILSSPPSLIRPVSSAISVSARKS